LSAPAQALEFIGGAPPSFCPAKFDDLFQNGIAAGMQLYNAGDAVGVVFFLASMHVWEFGLVRVFPQVRN
jgi:hypothetical protein